MTIRWTPDGKVERSNWNTGPILTKELADALDECVAALRGIAKCNAAPLQGRLIAEDTLRKLGVEP